MKTNKSCSIAKQDYLFEDGKEMVLRRMLRKMRGPEYHLAVDLCCFMHK